MFLSFFAVGFYLSRTQSRLFMSKHTCTLKVWSYDCCPDPVQTPPGQEESPPLDRPIASARPVRASRIHAQMPMPLELLLQPAVHPRAVLLLQPLVLPLHVLQAREVPLPGYFQRVTDIAEDAAVPTHDKPFPTPVFVGAHPGRPRHALVPVLLQGDEAPFPPQH